MRAKVREQWAKTASVGSTAEDQDVSGTITIPEVAHDTEEDDFVVRSFGQ